MAINKTYLKQMRVYKRLARWADRHPLLLNALMIAEVTAASVYVFMFY